MVIKNEARSNAWCNQHCLLKVCAADSKGCGSSPSESVSEKTFLSSKINENLYEIKDDQKLSKLQCKVCSERKASIHAEAKIP